MILTEMKAAAKKDMVNMRGELGFCDGFIDGQKVLVTAKKIGCNKPGRTNHIRYKITELEKKAIK
jgi:hypothetical protein